MPCFTGREPAANVGLARSNSTACRNDTPFIRITQSITVPPAWHAPRQCHRFVAGVTASDGVLSSWNGQCPIRFAPVLFNSTPEASTRRPRETSFFSRSISASGMRAIGFRSSA